MPWNLEITTFDIGQGESSLIVADDGQDEKMTMLIDGGLQAQGKVVNDNLNGILGEGTPIDHILVSHYDEDHCEGIIALLAADNYSAICMTVADIVMRCISGETKRPQIVAGAAAGCCAAFRGAYNDIYGSDYSWIARTAASGAINKVTDKTKDDAAIKIGIEQADSDARSLNPKLIPANSKTKRNKVSKVAALAAADGYASGKRDLALRNHIEEQIFTDLRTFINVNYRFNTYGRFSTVNIMDTGDTPGLPDSYKNIASGKILMSGNTWIQAPMVRRQRSTPALGAEILWNSGPNAKLAPDGSPMIFMMARRGQVWNWTGTLPQAIDNNNDCIGLILRFNNFFFYTGGDLIAEGENIIAQKIKQIGLPNPRGGTFAAATKIAAFKCGHHGANTCTSQTFLDRATPVAAIISCGDNSYDHPTQAVVTRLHDQDSIEYFYLTGCPTERDYIPATAHPTQNQLTTDGNKSRVAGGVPALGVVTPVGNIILTIDSQETLATGEDRYFTITYYDYDLPVGMYRTEYINF